MEMHHDHLDQPARDAASVVMVRDAPTGLQVFLHQRHAQSDVLGGAYVFPGGKRDADDEHVARHHLPVLAEELHLRLGEPTLRPTDAAALYAAALREAFEESGVLFAQGLTASELNRAHTLHQAGMGFDELLSKLSLQLNADALLPWSRWITPVLGGVVRKRFDTRFFLARPPDGQEASHDNHEAVHSLWIDPAEAIRQYTSGQIDMAPPQILGLAHLARHRCVESVWTEALSRPPPTILPESFIEDGVRSVCYPGDPRHSVPERALPGPTRLRWGQGRFEPPPGFEPLLPGDAAR